MVTKEDIELKKYYPHSIDHKWVERLPAVIKSIKYELRKASIRRKKR